MGALAGASAAFAMTISTPEVTGRCSRKARPPAIISTRIRAAISLELLLIRSQGVGWGLPLDRPPLVGDKLGGRTLVQRLGGDDHSGDGQETLQAGAGRQQRAIPCQPDVGRTLRRRPRRSDAAD